MNCHSIATIIYLSISELQYGNSKHAKNKLCERFGINSKPASTSFVPYFEGELFIISDPIYIILQWKNRIIDSPGSAPSTAYS